jgi:hypothetical protein
MIRIYEYPCPHSRQFKGDLECFLLEDDRGQIIRFGGHRCDGNHQKGREIRPRLELNARRRLALEQEVGFRSSHGFFSQEDAAEFLDRLFADPVEILAAAARESRAA